MHTVKYSHIHPPFPTLSLTEIPSTASPPPPPPSSSFFSPRPPMSIFCSSYVHKWGRPLEHGKPISSHTLKGEWVSLPAAVNCQQLFGKGSGGAREFSIHAGSLGPMQVIIPVVRWWEQKLCHILWLWHLSRYLPFPDSPWSLVGVCVGNVA